MSHVTWTPVSGSKGQGHQAALVGCSGHHITYLDANSLYDTAQSHHLHKAEEWWNGYQSKLKTAVF